MFFAVALLLGTLPFVKPQGFEQVWVVSGRPVDLNCEIGRKSCFILSPSKRLFDSAKSYDDDTVFDAYGSDDRCLLRLASVEGRDFGRWTCFVGGKAVKVLDLISYNQSSPVIKLL